MPLSVVALLAAIISSDSVVTSADTVLWARFDRPPEWGGSDGPDLEHTDNPIGIRSMRPVGIDGRLFSLTGVQDTVRRRQRAVRLSEGYATRLKIHQIGAYAMLPLAVTQYLLGRRLINRPDRPDGIRTAHQLTAIGIGTVALANTVTGALNWWETRKVAEGRARRTIHALLMLAADTGFLLTALKSSDADESLDDARDHRRLAEVSFSITAVSALMMLIWKD